MQEIELNNSLSQSSILRKEDDSQNFHKSEFRKVKHKMSSRSNIASLNLNKVKNIITNPMLQIKDRRLNTEEICTSVKLHDKKYTTYEGTEEAKEGTDTQNYMPNNSVFFTNQDQTTGELVDFYKRDFGTEPIAKILKLEVAMGSLIPAETVIQIAPNGMIGSKRDVHDGNVYFGTAVINVILTIR